MRLRDLSIQAKVLVTALGALLVVLGVATTASLRYWEKEQFALTSDHALMAVAAAKEPVEAALAHGQVGIIRDELQAMIAHPPAVGYRIVSAEGLVLLSSVRSEEGRPRPGAALPSPWDIPAEGQVVGGRGDSTMSAVIAVSGVGGPGARATLELELGVRGINEAIRRGRTYGLILTLVLVIGFAAALVAMMEREVLGPMRQLRRGLARASAGEDGVRIGLERKDEFGRLGATVDALLERDEAKARLAATQQRTLTEQAGFAEVGALAAQVAHEIKRPLAGIKSAMELITQEYAMSDAEKTLLSRVEDELQHVDETLRDLLSLARPVGLNSQPLDLHGVINAALVRLSGLPGADRVSVQRDFAPRLPAMMGDAARLEQAVLNLCVNAVEAMPEGGRLTITTRAADGVVDLDVADTGVGIPPENLDRILKPFFSTKSFGTGLGLPLVARVVAAHGGRLWVESETGAGGGPHGTTFHVHLPAAGSPAAEVEGAGGKTWPANGS
ncbi:MAG TPA: ATP-binding protein [Gemmatimonadales bacterium]|nr:ATP-binding protein [Gemmatimonadales bacterium]